MKWRDGRQAKYKGTLWGWTGVARLDSEHVCFRYTDFFLFSPGYSKRLDLEFLY